ncbi:MAG: flavohemoglobin expression-modulating QEGLA motif protein [Labilibaculum sp.]|nr:flavohemoglobin expression-modulating QEGLA motif protein [Labilibaculum sp.]MBI9058264.1 flavohemoglobin expression-modulating QEGLA motif protein [Labilibaculum sp.]
MKVISLSLNEILSKINKGETFEAMPDSGGFIVKINKYVPYCCTAIHNGGLLRNELKNKIALSDYERWYEEDPHTADFIASMPITIVGLDSRFEYDLNRSPDNCIYEEAWDKKVWKKKLTNAEIKVSKLKHANYFKVVGALVSKIETMFGGCVVYDLHSYNYKRWEREVPIFNIGTENIDKEKFKPYIDNWLSELSSISLPQTSIIANENDVFFGRGYNLEFITKNFNHTLVLATEVKKVFCDELNGDAFPKVIRLLQQKLKVAILNNANLFSQNLKNWHFVSTPKLLDKTIDNSLLKIDKSLFSYLRSIELLASVNPTNTKSEKRKFFRSKFTELPKFKYQPVRINPFSYKQNILSIPVKEIHDVSIRNMYESVINSYTDKLDLIGTINTKKFLYNSLRYFGRPSKKDLLNAEYLMHLPDIPGGAKREPVYNAKDAMQVFRTALDDYDINAKIEFSSKVISQVMVLNSKKTILIQPDSTFRKKELNALIEHEIGVHMVTTMNSSMQKLKIFNLGLPVNTQTQEGLAILAEYLSGNITLKRLKKIALRVIIVDMMCSGADFIECFNTLVNEHDIDENDAYIIVTRIFRGGGFTKDYLYLSGFVEIFKLWENQYDLTPLLIGKTSLPFFNTIEEMLGREMIEKPKYITKSFLNPKSDKNNIIYEYILSGLR